MPSMKDLVRSAHRGDRLYVAPKHAEWVERPEREQVYTEEAIQFVASTLRGDRKHERSGRFSPSSLGRCNREVMFGYYGAPKEGENLDGYELMGLGTWGHLRWQAEGISMGWIKEGERWVFSADLKLGGSIDALLGDDSVLELKTAGMGIYSKVVTKDEGPKYEHQLQRSAYQYLDDREWCSLVYEERATGQFHEFRLARSSQYENEMLDIVRLLNGFADNHELPPMRDDCEMRVGSVYRSCPYRKYCPTRDRNNQPIKEEP